MDKCSQKIQLCWTPFRFLYWSKCKTCVQCRIGQFNWQDVRKKLLPQKKSSSECLAKMKSRAAFGWVSCRSSRAPKFMIRWVSFVADGKKEIVVLNQTDNQVVGWSSWSLGSLYSSFSPLQSLQVELSHSFTIYDCLKDTKESSHLSNDLWLRCCGTTSHINVVGGGPRI